MTISGMLLVDRPPYWWVEEEHSGLKLQYEGEYYFRWQNEKKDREARK
jgi:hypothetical protein